jgi:hypothetical protein
MAGAHARAARGQTLRLKRALAAKHTDNREAHTAAKRLAHRDDLDYDALLDTHFQLANLTSRSRAR